jgi:hypothetical protein
VLSARALHGVLHGFNLYATNSVETCRWRVSTGSAGTLQVLLVTTPQILVETRQRHVSQGSVAGYGFCWHVTDSVGTLRVLATRLYKGAAWWAQRKLFKTIREIMEE